MKEFELKTGMSLFNDFDFFNWPEAEAATVLWSDGNDSILVAIKTAKELFIKRYNRNGFFGPLELNDFSIVPKPKRIKFHIGMFEFNSTGQFTCTSAFRHSFPSNAFDYRIEFDCQEVNGKTVPIPDSIRMVKT